MVRYIRAYDAQGQAIGVERIDDPVFVRWQLNGLKVRCEESEAQAIVSASGEETYLINGAMPHGESEPYAVFIREAEYEAAASGEGDEPEQDEQQDEQDERPMTRAELTERLKELESDRDFLTSCILEMSEAVYG